MDKMQKKLIRQEILSGSYKGNPFSATLDQLGYLGLTEAGRIELSKFPDAAISYAHTQLSRKKGLSDPFPYFCGVAVSYARTNNLPIDHEWSNLLYGFYKIDSTSLKTNQRNIVPEPSDIYGEDIINASSSKHVSPPKIWQPESRERRHGITELTKLVLSLHLDGIEMMIRMWGGKDGVFDYLARMAFYWDNDLTKEEALVEAKAYSQWCQSDLGRQMLSFFGKHLPFWSPF